MIATANQECACKVPNHSGRLIVLTGGPGAGKTAVLEVLRAALCRHVAVLPEAASILFRGGFPREDSEAARQAVQRTIFYAQRQLEELALSEGHHAVVLCDRGTIDGVAYWTGDEASLFTQMGVTRDHELARYAAVIHLRSPSADGGYDHKNPARTETAEQARRIDDAIESAWRGHPNRTFVEPHADFLDKAREAIESVRKELPGCCRGHRMPHEEPARPSAEADPCMEKC
jgi:predicted ATPase